MVRQAVAKSPTCCGLTYRGAAEQVDGLPNYNNSHSEGEWGICNGIWVRLVQVGPDIYLGMNTSVAGVWGGHRDLEHKIKDVFMAPLL